jgi:hypothetical protein
MQISIFSLIVGHHSRIKKPVKNGLKTQKTGPKWFNQFTENQPFELKKSKFEKFQKLVNP